MDSRADAPVYRFGPFELDAGRRRLTKNGQLFPLPDRQLDVLQVLCAAGGRLVSKNELAVGSPPKARAWFIGLIPDMKRYGEAESQAAVFVPVAAKDELITLILRARPGEVLPLRDLQLAVGSVANGQPAVVRRQRDVMGDTSKIRDSGPFFCPRSL
jgi:hypothetical protein